MRWGEETRSLVGGEQEVRVRVVSPWGWILIDTAESAEAVEAVMTVCETELAVLKGIVDVWTDGRHGRWQESKYLFSIHSFSPPVSFIQLFNFIQHCVAHSVLVLFTIVHN